MDMPFFDFIEGLSPWWWVAFGIALGAIEMATMSFFLIWPGLAALLMAVVVTLFPGMPGEVQVAVFAALSVALTFVGRSYMIRFGDGGEPEGNLNKRSGRLVGRRGKVLNFEDGEGTVEVDGVPWHAVSDGDVELELGSRVKVVNAEGMTLEIAAD